MNRILKMFSLLPALCIMLSGISCKGGEENTPSAVADPVITPSTLSVAGDISTQSIEIKTTEVWVLSSDAQWVKFSPPGGNGSSDPVMVSLLLTKNQTGESRKATVTLKTVSGKTASMTLTQTAEESGIVQGIASAADFAAFSEAVNEGKAMDRFIVNGAVTLIQDIDMTGVTYTPAGTSASPFKGTFNGQGHTIKGVSAPLFGVLKGATIRNLHYGASGDVIKITSEGDSNYGGVSASATGTTFDHVYFEATLDVKAGSGHPRVGGITGFLSSDSSISSCYNNGNVLCNGEGWVGGFAGENEGVITESTAKGNVLGVYSSDRYYGPGWICGSNKTKANITKMTADGHCGDYNLYSSDPSKAPASLYRNAVCYPRTNAFALTGSDDDAVTVNWKLDDYYAWEEIDSKVLMDGVKWTKYDCLGVPRIVNIIELDLTKTGFDITTSYADDIVPNPNGNKNGNNGYNKRETLSQICNRKRAEGQDIIAGINTGFFDSNDGFGRGFHIEEGQPVYINNTGVVKQLPNHSWAFTVFTDRTTSCEKKVFTGKVEISGKEYQYHSINDTILRHANATYQLNLYTSRYKKTPHAGLTNPLATNVLYVVAEYTGEPMKVNTGYADATVNAIYDGLESPLSSAPYLSGSKEIALAASGDTGRAIGSGLKVGDKIRLKADMTIDGTITKPIYTQNSTMYKLMTDGKDASNTPGSSASLYSTYDPMTYVAIDKNTTKVWLIEIDGRQEWFSLGVKGYEMYRIADKLGAWNVTRFDGGGSSAMWIYNAEKGSGALVNSPSDSKGERSDMNYILIRKK